MREIGGGRVLERKSSCTCRRLHLPLLHNTYAIQSASFSPSFQKCTRLLKLAIGLLAWVTESVRQLLLQGRNSVVPAWQILGTCCKGTTSQQNPNFCKLAQLSRSLTPPISQD